MENYSRRDFFKGIGKGILGISAFFGLVSLVNSDEIIAETTIREYHGGLKPSGYWRKWENMKRELREAIKAK